MFRPYRTVLSRPGALAFSSWGVLARLPISMVGIGIVLMVSALHGSYALAGQVSGAYVVAQAVCSPALARLVDRHGQARVMRPAVVVSAAALTALIVAAAASWPTWTLYVAAAVTGAAMGSLGALVRARWSYLLTEPAEVHTAYALESALDELVFIIGPVLATLLATGVRPEAGLVVPVAAGLVGGLALLRLRSTEPPAATSVDGPRVRGSVMRSPGMLVLAAVFVAMGAIFGATDVSTVAFAQEQGDKAAAGAVLAAFAAGSMVAGFGYGARHWTTPLWRRFAIGVVALACGVSLFFAATSLPVLAVVMFVTGFTIAPTLVNGNGMVQQFVAPSRLTEGLTWVGTSLGIGVSGGSAVAGAAIDAFGSRGGFNVVMGAGALAVVATVASLRTLRAGVADVDALERVAAESAASPRGTAPGE